MENEGIVTGSVWKPTMELKFKKCIPAVPTAKMPLLPMYVLHQKYVNQNGEEKWFQVEYE